MKFWKEDENFDNIMCTLVISLSRDMKCRSLSNVLLIISTYAHNILFSISQLGSHPTAAPRSR